MDTSTLTAFMDAVTEYYGKNVWNTITTNSRFLAPEFAEKVTAIEGVNAVYNNAGNVMYYTYNGQIVSQAVDVANVVNSNAGTTALSTTASVPANTTIVETTGEVIADTGLKEYAGGATVAGVMKDVAVSVAAVSAGIKLGTMIDGALYNANPQYWDSIGMSSLNPQMWNSICRTEGGKTLFNLFFGINSNNKTMTAYMDENAFAYIAGYMNHTGALKLYEDSTTIDDTTGLTMTGITLPVESGKFFSNDYDYASNRYTQVWEIGTHSSDVKVGTYINFDPVPSNLDTLTVVFASENPFTVIRTDTRTGISEHIASSERTFKNKTFYMWYLNAFTFVINPQGVYNVTDVEQFIHNETLAYILLYGDTIHVSGVDGITPQPGATVPFIPDDTAIAQILQYLKTNYPDLFTDSIYNDVVQPDGTVSRKTYVSVGTPDTIPENSDKTDVNPTGGEGTSQDNPAVNPETTPEETVKTAEDIVTETNPYNPTDTPPETNYPDTGTGDTPTVVIPTGTAKSLFAIYNPDQSELNNFGAWLWSPAFVDQLLKLFNDPMQSIIGLHKVFAPPVISGTDTIHVGYLDSGVSSNVVGAQYVTVNCGSISLQEYFGNVFDYDPFTEVSIYLPFIGIERLDVGDVMRSTIEVVYHVDVITGACLAEVNVTRDLSGGTLYTYSGNCAVQYPISSGSYMGIVASIASIAGGVVGTIASGGALAPVALGAVNGVLGARTRVEHSGSFSGNAGAMGIKKPYLIITRPQTALASTFPSFNGYPANESVTLNSCTGFIKCDEVHLENIPATSDELNEIESLLKTGIII